MDDAEEMEAAHEAAAMREIDEKLALERDMGCVTCHSCRHLRLVFPDGLCTDCHITKVEADNAFLVERMSRLTVYLMKEFHASPVQGAGEDVAINLIRLYRELEDAARNHNRRREEDAIDALEEYRAHIDFSAGTVRIASRNKGE